MTGIRFPVEEGHVQAFARALGEEDGHGVPLTFPIAFAHFDPDWPLRMRPDRPWNGSGAEPGTPRAGGGLHAEQEFTYVRPVRVGETLTARRRQGRTWQKAGSRGLLNFTERHVDFVDADGELVVRSTAVTVTVTPTAPADDQEEGR